MFRRIYMRYALMALMMVVIVGVSACSSGTNPLYSTNTQVPVGMNCTSVNTGTGYTGTFSNTINGTLQLTIASSNMLPTGSTTVRNFSASGTLTLNGRQYCCTTYGGTGSMTTDPNVLAYGNGLFSAAITSLSLRCSAIGNSAGSGVYGGQYYTGVISVDLPIATTQWPSYVFVGTDAKLYGFMRVNQNYSSPLPSYGFGGTDPNSVPVFLHD
jgi:hypothetical protein